MPVDIDDTTKLSEEQRKFFWQSRDRHHEDDGKPQQLSIYHIHRPTAQTSPQQRAASTHFPTDEPKFSTKSSSKTAKRIFFHCLVLVRPDLVHCDDAIFSMHVQHMIVMQRRTGAPHSVTRPRGGKRAPDPWVEVDREGARARYRCLQRVVSRQSGVTSSPL